MDSPPHADTPVPGGDSERDHTGRDLRDVLRGLVVAEDGAGGLSQSDIARAAARTDRFVPELLTALEDGSAPVRVGAAWTLCALADDQPGAVSFLAERLTDRVDDGPFEVGQVLSYLRGRYPGRVADAVDAAVEADGHRTDGTEDGPEADPDRSGGTTPRSTSAGKRVETDGGVAGVVADLGDGRQVVRREPPRHPGSSPTAPPKRGRLPTRSVRHRRPTRHRTTRHILISRRAGNRRATSPRATARRPENPRPIRRDRYRPTGRRRPRRSPPSGRFAA